MSRCPSALYYKGQTPTLSGSDNKETPGQTDKPTSVVVVSGGPSNSGRRRPVPPYTIQVTYSVSIRSDMVETTENQITLNRL